LLKPFGRARLSRPRPSENGQTGSDTFQSPSGPTERAEAAEQAGQAAAQNPAAGNLSERSVKVLMLGFSDSGKTTFLTCMWKHFKGTKDGIRFRTNRQSDIELNRSYENLRRRGTFPDSTPDTEPITFTVRAPVADRMIDVFTLTYIDYDGDLLDKWYEAGAAGDTARDLIESYINDAHVLLGVLDGAKIADMMDRKIDPDYAIWLSRLFSFIQEQDNKTVHLVVTKYDLLSKYEGQRGLEEIIAKLNEYEPFRQFRDFPRPGKIRLIPVAALGTRGFIRQENGVQVTDTESDLQPDDTEFPLACTLPDVLDTELARLKSAAPGYKQRSGGATPRWENYRLLHWVAALIAVELVPVSIPLAPFGHMALVMPMTETFNYLARLVGQGGGLLPASLLRWRRDRKLQVKTDDAEALEHVIKSWSKKIKELEVKYPMSTLNNGYPPMDPAEGPQ
jgi:GTPase SAR1 family protein